MQINNLDAARHLVKKYRSITRGELEDNAREDDCCYEALSRITGFGSLKNCCLCKECYKKEAYGEASCPDCTKCLYSWNNDSCDKWYHVPCVDQDTYCDIHNAESLDELYEAIQNRADFIENLIKEIENDN